MNPQLRTLCLLSLALALAGCSDTVVRDCRLAAVKFIEANAGESGHESNPR